MKVYSLQDDRKWNEIIRSFEQWDVYYLYEYAYSLYLHGDGIPLLFHYETSNVKICFVAMLKDISSDRSFIGLIPDSKYYDLETPYGYGGPLIEGHPNKSDENSFIEAFDDYCKANFINSIFVRFHPILKNQHELPSFFETKLIGRTVCIDISSLETIQKNLDSKNRNLIRKAEKNGVTITSDTGDQLDNFIRIYDQSMKEKSADSYYLFDPIYYQYICSEINSILFYARYQGRIIGASIFFCANQTMHYHLSAVDSQYRNLASTNLLIYTAALWGQSQGIKKLHLGGGMTANDSLYHFKKQFNKNGDLEFYVGRHIVDQHMYNELIEIRKQNDDKYNPDNPFFIRYRWRAHA